METFSDWNTPLVLGLLFLVGLAADLIGRFTFLPRITLLLVAGLTLGPFGLSLLPEQFVQAWFPALTTIALALIGFLLGEQLSLASLKQRGPRIVLISLCKVIGAWLAVGVALLLFGVPAIVAILLAGVAPATDPAATFDQVHESGAKDEFADTLLAIVAIDDMWGLLVFIAMLSLAGFVGAQPDAGVGVVSTLVDLGQSIGLGIALGVPMAYLTGRIRPGEPVLIEAIGFVLLGAGIAEALDLLPIVTAMSMGVAVASLARHHQRPFHAIEGIEWPFMILFFVLAGASLKLDALSLVAALTGVYIIARCIGIYAGTRVGTALVRAERPFRKYLGLALFPQAGVAVGMALLAAQRFPDSASVVLTVAIASTIILETLGPVFTRFAISAATKKHGVGANDV